MCLNTAHEAQLVLKTAKQLHFGMQCRFIGQRFVYGYIDMYAMLSHNNYNHLSYSMVTRYSLKMYLIQILHSFTKSMI